MLNKNNTRKIANVSVDAYTVKSGLNQWKCMMLTYKALREIFNFFLSISSINGYCSEKKAKQKIIIIIINK